MSNVYKSFNASSIDEAVRIATQEASRKAGAQVVVLVVENLNAASKKDAAVENRNFFQHFDVNKIDSK